MSCKKQRREIETTVSGQQNQWRFLWSNEINLVTNVLVSCAGCWCQKHRKELLHFGLKHGKTCLGLDQYDERPIKINCMPIIEEN